jgi:hypothetical protein
MRYAMSQRQGYEKEASTSIAQSAYCHLHTQGSFHALRIHRASPHGMMQYGTYALLADVFASLHSPFFHSQTNRFTMSQPLSQEDTIVA